MKAKIDDQVRAVKDYYTQQPEAYNDLWDAALDENSLRMNMTDDQRNAQTRLDHLRALKQYELNRVYGHRMITYFSLGITATIGVVEGALFGTSTVHAGLSEVEKFASLESLFLSFAQGSWHQARRHQREATKCDTNAILEALDYRIRMPDWADLADSNAAIILLTPTDEARS